VNASRDNALGSNRRGVVLYDGTCRFCTRWVLSWQPVLRRYGYGVDTLQAPWVKADLRLPPEEALADIRLLTAAGDVVSGADVYLTVARRIWWAWPFSIVFSLPGYKTLIHLGYRWFAQNRYCVAGECPIDSPPAPPAEEVVPV
jgi:predicted DCC family thiol-disulfide oxidoreductase YuxK